MIRFRRWLIVRQPRSCKVLTPGKGSPEFPGRQGNKLRFLLILAVLVGCSKTFVLPKKWPEHNATNNWLIFGGSPDRSNHVDAIIPPPLSNKWTFKASSAIGPSMIAVDGILYAPTLDGKLEVVNIADGERLGRVKLHEEVAATCAYFDGALYIAHRYGGETLARYDLRTGKTIWKIDAGDIASEPLVSGEGIYVSALYRHIDKYDLDTGEKIWSFKSKDQHRSSPALHENTLVVGCDNGFIYALNAKDGSEKWLFETKGSVFATPVLAEQTIFVGSADSTFYALELESGSVSWSFQAKSPIFTTAATDGDRVVFGASDGRLYCLSAKTGQLNWSFEATSVVSTAPLITGEIVYFGSLDQKYYGLRLRDGKEIWSFTTQGRIRTSPVVWGDYVLGASEDKYIYGFTSPENITADKK